MSFRDTTTSGASGEVDETYKRIFPSKTLAIPEIGAGRLYFRVTRGHSDDVLHAVEFWLNIGINKVTGKPIAIPRISPNAFSDFMVTNRRTGAKFVSKSASEKGCPLSKLADSKHPLIALTDRKDDDGNFKPNINSIHAVRVQLIDPVRDNDGKVVKDAQNNPTFKIRPQEMIFKMRQGWWDQFVNLIEPDDTRTAGVDDGFTDAPAQTIKKMLTPDITKVIFFIEKKKRVKNATGNPKMDVDYVIDFSDKAFIREAVVGVEDPIEDLRKVFVAPTREELDDLMAKADGKASSNSDGGGATHSAGEASDDASRYGEQVPPPAGADDDDIPF